MGVMFEKEADKQLRTALKALDKSVNSFADKNGLGLSQGQHDALVLFSFENGTAWTTGTGDFQSAVAGGIFVILLVFWLLMKRKGKSGDTALLFAQAAILLLEPVWWVIGCGAVFVLLAAVNFRELLQMTAGLLHRRKKA